jgi:hypothetical protein
MHTTSDHVQVDLTSAFFRSRVVVIGVSNDNNLYTVRSFLRQDSTRHEKRSDPIPFDPADECPTLFAHVPLLRRSPRDRHHYRPWCLLIRSGSKKKE